MENTPLSEEGQLNHQQALQEQIQHLQKLLKQNETRFALVCKATNDAIWDWDLITNHVWRNEGFTILFDYETENIEPNIEWWFARIHPNDRQRVRQGIYDQFFYRSNQWIEEYRFQKKDGNYCFVIDRGYTLYDEWGKYYRMLGCMEDVTERKQAEEALLKSQRTFKILSETIPQLIWTSTPEGIINYTNQRWFEYTGLTFEQLKGQGWELAFHPQDLPDLLQRWQQALCTMQPHQIEARIRNTQGVYRWFLIRALPLTDSQGNVNQWVGTNTDIEEHKKLSEELQVLTQKLITANNTLQITNQDLAQANERLTQTNEELDQYVYKVSHDIRSPIASILGVLSLLQQEGLSDQAQTYINIIENRINRLDDFIKSVLAHSRNLNSSLSCMLINFELIIDHCLEELYYLPDYNKLHLIKQLPVVSAFWSDELRLNIVFKNLISNAIKYRRYDVESFLSIRINIVDEEAIIELEDNGQGIEEAYLEKVFMMFFRANEKADGPGLGLYIVKQVVERMGGKITLKSQVTQGTLFTITLPNLQINTINGL